MKEQMTESVIQMAEETLQAEPEYAGDCERVTSTVRERKLLLDNRGVGVVEVILILVVLIALFLIFKEQIGNMVTKAMDALEKSINEVLS